MDKSIPPSSSLGVVLITGAAKRLGRELSLALAKDGYDIAVHCHRSLEEAFLLQKDIQNMGRQAEIFPQSFDVDWDINKYLLTIQDHMGGMVGLINNASLFEYDVPGEASLAQLEKHYRINTVVPIGLSQAFYHAARCESTTTGNINNRWIINILDQKLRYLNPDYFSYTLGKSALASATTMMAMQFAPWVRVCAILPGLILPNEKKGESVFQRGQLQALLPKSGNVEQVIATARFLIQQNLMTGEMIAVDGGQHLCGLPRDVAFLDH